MKRTPSTSFRLDALTRRLLVLLARKLELTQTAVLEAALEEKASREGIIVVTQDEP